MPNSKRKHSAVTDKSNVSNLKFLSIFPRIPEDLFINNVLREYFSWKDLSIFSQVSKEAHRIGTEEKNGVQNARTKLFERFGYQFDDQDLITKNNKYWVNYEALYQKFNTAEIVSNKKNETTGLKKKKQLMIYLHNGEFKVAKAFLSNRGKVNVFFVDTKGSSPIAIAAAKGDLEMIYFLLNKFQGFWLPDQLLNTHTKFVNFYHNNKKTTIHPIIAALRTKQSLVVQFFIEAELPYSLEMLRQIFKLIIKNNDSASLATFFSKITYSQLHPDTIYWAIEYSMNKSHFHNMVLILEKCSLGMSMDKSVEINYPVAKLFKQSIINCQKKGNSGSFDELYVLALETDNIEIFKQIKDFIQFTGGNPNKPEYLEYGLKTAILFASTKILNHFFINPTTLKEVCADIVWGISYCITNKAYDRVFKLLKICLELDRKFFNTVINTQNWNKIYSEMDASLKQEYLVFFASINDAESEKIIFRSFILHQKLIEFEILLKYKLDAKDTKGLSLATTLQFALKQKSYIFAVVVLEMIIKLMPSQNLTKEMLQSFINVLTILNKEITQLPASSMKERMQEKINAMEIALVMENSFPTMRL